MHRTVETIRPSRSRTRLPAIVVDSARPGPTVAITANVHGDECTGLGAVLALDRRLCEGLVRGRAVLYPTLNPSGLRARSRDVAEDGADLNRSFPGDPAGAPTERLAAAIWADLVDRDLDLLIDLHADSAVSIPYAILDRPVRLGAARRASMGQRLEGLGAASGLTVLREYPDELYLRFRLDRSLAGAMVNHAAKPALTIEAGPRGAVDPRTVGVVVEAVWAVLASEGAVPGVARAGEAVGGPWRRASAPRSPCSGVFVAVVAPGEAFRAGEILGEVRALDGAVRHQLRAEADGIVVSWFDGAWVEVGTVPGTLGLKED